MRSKIDRKTTFGILDYFKLATEVADILLNRKFRLEDLRLLMTSIEIFIEASKTQAHPLRGPEQYRNLGLLLRGHSSNEAFRIFLDRLATRPRTCLERDGIRDFPSLVRRTERELSRINHMGPNSLRNINDELEKLGLELGMDEVEYENVARISVRE